MAVFKKDDFSIELGFSKLSGEFDGQDRQCAWELYSELCKHSAARGRWDANGEHVFVGEICLESLKSLRAFYQSAGDIMRRYPVGAVGATHPELDNHLGFFIARMLEAVLRPFLDAWETSYRIWWEHSSDKDKPPFERQLGFPQRASLEDDWKAVREFLRQTLIDLAETYAFPDLENVLPPDASAAWLEQTRRICAVATVAKP